MKSCIIGGVSRSGKSQLSKMLHEKNGFSRIPSDFIMNALGNTFLDGGMSHELPWKQASMNFSLFSNYILEGFLYTPENNIVYDSYHIHPKYLSKRVLEKYKVVFLGYPNINPLEKLENIRKYESIHGGRTVKHSDQKILERVYQRVTESAQLQTICIEMGVKFVDVSNSRDYENTIEETYDYLIS